MRGLHLERAAEPVVDAGAVIAPRPLRIGARPEAIVLQTLAVLGEGDAPRVVVREARAVKPLVRPPELTCVETRVRNGTLRQELGVEWGRLEDAQAR